MYRHIPSANHLQIEDIARTGTVPLNPNGNYMTFQRFKSAESAKDGLQLPHDGVYRVTLDTREIVDEMKIPNGKWGEAGYLEPIAKDFDEFGNGGFSQAVVDGKVKGVIEIVDLRTGEVIFPKRPSHD